MVDVYKKPKNMSIGMYYSKDYIDKRRNNNYYGYSHNYRGYNYYNMLHNYRRGIHYEAQRGVATEEHREKQKEEVPVSGPAKDVSDSGKTEGKKRKAEKETEKDEVGSRDKKKETSTKKCIIKILKRPTEAVRTEEGKGKTPVQGEKDPMEESEQKEAQKEQQKKKKKEKVKENEPEGAKDCVEQSGRKKKEGEGTTSKAKKVKDGFKFTSTQELFNLLLKDVKNNSLDEEEQQGQKQEQPPQQQMAKQAEKKKAATTTADPAKGPSEGTKMESENENAMKITKKSIPNLVKKGTTSAAGGKDTQPDRNDNVAQQLNHEEEKITKESEQRKSIKIKAKEGNSSSDVPKSDKIIEAEEKFPNVDSKNSAAQTTKATGASEHLKESVIALKGKKGIASGSNKYNNQMNIGSNISKGRKIIKINKNVENGRYSYTGSRKDLTGGANGFGGAAGHYVKYATSRYPNFTSRCSLLSHASKMDLCKHNSMGNRLTNSLSGGMGSGQRNDDSRKAGKKEEEEGFFAIPIYMRSPKPEQIPIPVYLSEVTDQVGPQEGVQERVLEVREVLTQEVDIKEDIKEDIKMDVKAAIEALPEAPSETTNVHGMKSKSKGQSQNGKGTPNGNAHNKDSQNGPNFTKKNVEKKKKNKTFLNKNYMSFNQEQIHANRHSYDFVNTGGNVKSNKVYNMHSLHSSYVKGANYNGCNVHGSGKNIKMEKYFHHKRYKVKAYSSDNNQRSKNLNPLKEVKIAVY
ncbi:hypothetical protein C922_02498 [Plasmodium inui San Antonio 1]|uniref:Uncharacterized protein n=1 Tax=Plasmodium inui San Antonio 1 TaxID=1237626 RepID=W7ACR8_9APIC|nr:hypothetical protein C922_02498 [Plasmodium inui San Antonio 1]EUD66914.1 hypothetical protein C922_02498 [Plasmodium inui San Antonio 1]